MNLIYYYNEHRTSIIDGGLDELISEVLESKFEELYPHDKRHLL
jgi:hypothetical protein